MAGLLQTTSGALLANLGVVERLGQGTCMFADEARDLPVRTLLTRSDDVWYAIRLPVRDALPTPSIRPEPRPLAGVRGT